MMRDIVQGLSGGRALRDFTASFVVFLVAMPLCMGIAIASGVPPERGLLTGIIGGIVVGLVSGAPLQVSGPAAGLVVMVYEIVEQQGMSALAAILVVAGLLQCLAGLLRLGRWFRAISPAVVHGMLAGIGVLIVIGQLYVLVDEKPLASGPADDAVESGRGDPFQPGFALTLPALGINRVIAAPPGRDQFRNDFGRVLQIRIDQD